MVECQICGKDIQEDSKYCNYCGTRQGEYTTEKFSVAANDAIKRVQELLHEGNVTRIRVKDEKGNQLLEIPATVGVVGALLAPWMAALGVIAAIATRCTIIVERTREPNVNSIEKKAADVGEAIVKDAKKAGKVVVEKAEEVVEDIEKSAKKVKKGNYKNNGQNQK